MNYRPTKLACFLAIFFTSALLPTSVHSQDLARVESTEFTRGADVPADALKAGRAGHYGPDWDEGPKRQVKVSAFRISKKQVTMEEFARFVPDYRQRIESRGATWAKDGPAVLVSWNEAMAYCEWLGGQTKQSCRLPTEAEWELAASRPASSGLSGIADGIQEWCFDWWAPYPTDKSVLKDPRGPEIGVVRILRDGGGGSIEEQKSKGETVTDYRVTDRSATVPDDRRPNLGFRIVVGKLPPTVQDQENLKRELLSAPFLNVESKPFQWKAHNGTTPHFHAGGKFIDIFKDSSASLPYWNRHHAPSLTYCDNGDLLATAFTAPFDNSDQMAILITRLRAGKKKWDPPARFFVAPDHNVTGATLFNAGDGVIHHYNGLGNNRCENFSLIKRVSRDNGATWSAPKIVHRYQTGAATPENPFGKPRLWPHMDLKSWDIDGRRVLIMSTDVGAGNELGSAIFASRDDGDSWRELTRTGWQSENFPLDGKQAGWIAGIHAPVQKLSDDSLLAFGRSSNIDDSSPMSRSVDFGKSWTYSASPFPPILSAQRPVLVRLTEGPLLFVSFTDTVTNLQEKKLNGMDFIDSAGNLNNGSGMFAAVSFDDGKTWPTRKLIPFWHKHPWKSLYSGYLSCVQTPDGMIHLVNSTYYFQFNLAWLEQKIKPRKPKP